MPMRGIATTCGLCAVFRLGKVHGRLCYDVATAVADDEVHAHVHRLLFSYAYLQLCAMWLCMSFVMSAGVWQGSLVEQGNACRGLRVEYV
jgi:hypothetical protein